MMLSKSRIWIALLAAALLSAGCGQTQRDPQMPPLPQGANEDGLADTLGMKADGLTNWFVVEKGTLDLGATVTGLTSPKEWFHGYTIKLDAGTTLGLEAFGGGWGNLHLYMQGRNGKYGAPVKRAYLAYDAKTQGYRATFAYTAKSAGVYLVVIGSYWSSNYKYEVVASCKGGCPVKPHCVEYETLDENGKPAQNFYVHNVKSYEEGKKLLANLQVKFTNEAINPGTCGEQSTACPRIWAPVCGQTKDGTKTFGNLCEFKVQVRKEAGKVDQSKGHWELGQCKTPHCLEYETVDENGKPYNNFYAINVDSYEEGKQILANMGSGFTKEAINPGTCADQAKICPDLWAPVCGSTATGTQTYGNVCEFKVAVRNEAGVEGESKGHFDLGQCPDVETPHCLEYETQDSAGNPLQNFYAINVKSYEEGKKILAAMPGQFFAEQIRPGSCGEQGTMCPLYWAPVCGELNGNQSTYGNVCEFKVAIRQAAGKVGEAKGHWEKGQCQLPPVEVKFETLAKGSYSGYMTFLETSHTDLAKFEALWKQHTSNTIPPAPVPAVDFDNEMIIAVFLGTMNTGGYSVAITSVTDTGNELLVAYTRTAPGAGCMVTMALTQPHHIIKLPTSSKPVIFQSTSVVTKCN